MMRKINSEVEGDDRLWTTTAYPVALLFQNKLISLLKIMLISDEPLLSSQPPLDSHLLVPRGWPLKGGSTVLSFSFECVTYFMINRFE